MQHTPLSEPVRIPEESPLRNEPPSAATPALAAKRPASLSATAVVGFGAVFIFLIGVLDYSVSPQISASLFYLLPILFVTHYAGRSAGLFAAVMATSVWLAADLSDGYATPWIACWNALMRLGVFLVVVLLVSAMRSLNASLEKRVQERTARLQAEIRERTNLEKRILEITDREQARIGQDLHDGLCQHLVGTTFTACRLQERLEARGMPEAADVAQIAAQLDESITQARNLARGLHPVPVEEQGLATALQELTEGVHSRFNISCALICEGVEKEPAEETAIHLYRIAQEAVTNAIKHAKPQHIEVHLMLEDSRFELRVENDGSEFMNRKRPDGMGLHIMDYRARMIGAQLSIQPRPDGGTRVICRSSLDLKSSPHSSPHAR
jgi:signal transduction histidine kinase